MFDNFEKLNFANMDTLSLTKWIRDNSSISGQRYYYEKLSLKHSMEVAKLLKEAYRCGEIRGKVLKN